jgi:RimJ/RimL family protein N-acetyltransferase
MITLTTERLLLRMFRETDLEAYAQMCADPEVVRYLGTGQTMSRPEAWRHMAMIVGHWHVRGYGLWAVEERATGQLIGRIGLFKPEGWPDVEVGWMLRRSSWGHGFATEGAQKAMHYAFETLRYTHVISMIRPDNTASIRVAERLGETLKQRFEIAGHEALVFGISRAAWERRGA